MAHAHKQVSQNIPRDGRLDRVGVYKTGVQVWWVGGVGSKYFL